MTVGVRIKFHTTLRANFRRVFLNWAMLSLIIALRFLDWNCPGACLSPPTTFNCEAGTLCASFTAASPAEGTVPGIYSSHVIRR